MAKKASEWFEAGMADWDISRDAPYFGIEIPTRRASTSTSGWTRPSATSPPEEPFRQGPGRPSLARGLAHLAELRRVRRRSAVEQVHFIGKDIVYFHTLFWPAMLKFSGRKTPNQVNVHGFITVNRREDEQEPRHRHRSAEVPALGMNPEWLRYYIAAKLSPRWKTSTSIPTTSSPASTRPDRQVHQHREPRGRFIAKRFGGRLVQVSAATACMRCSVLHLQRPTEHHRPLRQPRLRQGAARNHGPCRPREPTSTPTSRGNSRSRRHGRRGCTTSARHCIEAFRLLTLYLKPVLPTLASAGRDLPEERTAGLGHRAALPSGHPMRRVQAPDAARGREAARRSLFECRTEPSPWEAAPAGARAQMKRPARRRGHRPHHHHRRLRQDRPAHRADRELRGGRRLDQAAAPDARRGRGQDTATSSPASPRAYKPEDLVGKLTVVVANLAPRKMKFGVSEGMVLAASHADEKAQPGIHVLNPWPGAQPGMRVR
jgi:methionyl-tRNA synthetase